MRALTLVLALLLVSTFAVAQELPSDVFAVGVHWNQNATPQIGGGAKYMKRVTDIGTYQINYIDIYSKTVVPFTVAVTFMPGLAQKVFTIAGAPVMLSSAVGPAAGASEAGYAWTSGAFGIVSIGSKGWRLIPEVRWTKSNISSAEQTTNIFAGLSIAWGK